MSLLITRTVAVAIAACMPASPAVVICMNPLGCEPETQAECIKRSEGAKTEASAKAMLSQCWRLPVHSEKECKQLSLAWSSYLRSTGGVEWKWSHRNSKAECRERFPSTFKAALWVSREYCELNAARLFKTSQEVDAVSGRSTRLNQVRRTESLGDLTDDAVVTVLQQVYYKDMLPEEVAAALYIDLPPDVHQVKQECDKIAQAALKSRR